MTTTVATAPATTKIVWISRHSPSERQLNALTSHFPNHQLIIDARSFDSADTLIARYRAIGGDEMVVVAPLAVIRQLCRRGLHPLYAQMTQVPCDRPDAEITIGNGNRRRCYRFDGFARIRALDFRLEALPNAPTTTITTANALDNQVL